MDTHNNELLSAQELANRLHIPVYAVYRMVSDGRIVAHEMKREVWHKRRRMGFDPDEVQAALAHLSTICRKVRPAARARPSSP